jgi:hypothetical protein
VGHAALAVDGARALVRPGSAQDGAEVVAWCYAWRAARFVVLAEAGGSVAEAAREEGAVAADQRVSGG